MPLVTIDKSILAGLGSDIAFLKTFDGKPMVDLWNEVIVPSVNDYNDVLNALAEFIAYKSDQRIESVTQTSGSKWQSGDVEVSKAAGQREIRHFFVRCAIGSFRKYLGWTKKMIEKVSSTQLVEEFNAELKALTDQKYQALLGALYQSTEVSNFDPDTHEALKVTTLVNGTGNWPIPSIGFNTFDSTHTHFKYVDSSTSSWTDASNRQKQLKGLIKLVYEHGFRDNLLLMVGSGLLDDVQQCPGYRQIVDVSPFAQSADSALKGTDTQATIKVFRKLGGLFRVQGTVENATVIEGDILPPNYVGCFSYQGANSPANPVQWREEPVESFTTNPFPFYETNLETRFGAAIRQRLNGAIMLVANGANAYVVPSVGTAAAAVGDWDGQ